MGTYTSRALVDLTRVEQEINRLLREGCIKEPPVPTNIIAFFDPAHRVIIAAATITPIRGVLMPDTRGWKVLVDSDLSYLSRRFAIFHEGFHILERSGIISIDGPDEYREWLADQFAARLIMPRKWLIEDKDKDPRQLIMRYQASRRVVARRLKAFQL